MGQVTGTEPSPEAEQDGEEYVGGLCSQGEKEMLLEENN